MSVKNVNGYTTEIKLGEEAIRSTTNGIKLNWYKIEDIINLCERVN